MAGPFHSDPEVVHDAAKAPEVYTDPQAYPLYPVPQKTSYDAYSDKQAQAQTRSVYQGNQYLPLGVPIRQRGVPLIWVLSALALLIGIGAGIGIGYGAFGSQKAACAVTSSTSNNTTSPASTASSVTAIASSTSIAASTAGLSSASTTSLAAATSTAAVSTGASTPDSQCSDSQLFKSNLTSKAYAKSCDFDIPNSVQRTDIAANFIVWSFDECIAICDGANQFNKSLNMNTVVYSYGGVGQNGGQPAGSCYCLNSATFSAIAYKGINLARLKT